MKENWTLHQVFLDLSLQVPVSLQRSALLSKYCSWDLRWFFFFLVGLHGFLQIEQVFENLFEPWFSLLFQKELACARLKGVFFWFVCF